MKFAVIILLSLTTLSFSKKEDKMDSYVIEITTFKMKTSVNTDKLWIEDARVDANYTSKQPGYISRESAFDADTNEVLVVAKWTTMEHADKSMQKFMKDASVAKYANMIDGSTMKMKRYIVK